MLMENNRWGTDDGKPRVGDGSLLLTSDGAIVVARRCVVCKKLTVLPWNTLILETPELTCQTCHRNLHEEKD